ncbi:MAG: Ig-like domain-containing protein [Prevotellaceae bacterium]|jgi:hypothetical protein|nr:Ig-like domain-containing protein [Prevotellaceae bacterium]
MKHIKIFAALALLLAASCSKDDNTVKISEITLDKTSVKLTVGETYIIWAEIIPENATDQALTWSSSNETVATVSDAGKVTAVEIGNSVITVASGTVKAVCSVTVEPDIYVGGYERNVIPVIWKNGKAKRLVYNYFEVRSVYVSGNDVYAAGDDSHIIRLWKNGEEQEFTNETQYTYARSVYVSDGDVYIAGQRGESAVPNAATLWKNGVAKRISSANGNDACAFSVFVSGSDVYVAGNEWKTGFINYVAILWKNGIAQNLTDGTKHANALSVYVSGSDVYAGGYEKSAANYGSPSIAKLWKNGAVQNLTDGTKDAIIRSVYVSDGDVYAAGYEKNEDGKRVAKLWKNGVAQNLTDGTKGAEVYSVCVFEGDVYASGYEENDAGHFVAKLWKNGEEYELAIDDYTRSSVAYSVFVKRKD